MRETDLVHDWNSAGDGGPLLAGPIGLVDETLRDGLQSPSAANPTFDQKIQLVELANQLGIQTIDLGMPGAGARAAEDCRRLIEHIRDSKLAIAPAMAARTHPGDIQAIIDISQRTGVAIEVMTFIGSSPIRQYVEEWDLNEMLALSARAIAMAVRNHLPIAFVTEDTTRSRPEVLSRLFIDAVERGASRLIICDTVGHATPDGVRRILAFTRALLVDRGFPQVGIDWHGHDDRGLALANTLAAAESGASRLHGTALGIGERAGNAALDQLLVNLALMNRWPAGNLGALEAWCKLAASACRVPIPARYPVLGRDAFRTATGVHAAAVLKARHKGDAWLADRVYSGVPASIVGREQEIEVGHASGASNVIHRLAALGFTTESELVDAVLVVAKSSDRLLDTAQISGIVADYRQRAASAEQE
jgi:2-isopropylmalate synthase